MQENAVLKYESVLNDLFKKIGLKPNQCHLIRAFLTASRGETIFEVSHGELAQILFNDSATNLKTNKQRVSDWFEALQKWQKANNLELVRLVESGYREETAGGRFAYHKSTYEFVMLGEFVKLVYSAQEGVEADLDAVIAKLKEQYQPPKKFRAYHPRHSRKKSKNTIFTLLKHIFDYSIQVDENPVEACQDVLDEAWEKLGELEGEWKEQQKKDEIISKFEALLGENDADENKGELALEV